jgi:hypothetical protein
MINNQTECECRCIFTGETLEHLHTLKNMPLHFGTTTQSRDLDEFADQAWMISSKSGIVQLRDRVPLDKLYPEQTTVSAIGPLWKKHHKEFAAFVMQANKNTIIEIGGAHGILAENVYEMDSSINWVIVEPNPSPLASDKIKFIPEFFTKSTKLPFVPELVVHSHTIEHLYDPISFLETIHDLENENLEMIFSIPDLNFWIRQKFLNALNFEHTYFLSEDLMESMLAYIGFRVIRKQFWGHHSIFYHVAKTAPGRYKNIKNQKTIVKEYFNYYTNEIKRINDLLNGNKNDVFLFGGHIFSQYLLSNGLLIDNLIAIIDNDEAKHGRRLYGTDISVTSPQILQELENPIVILKAGSHQMDIKNGLMAINSNIQFIE